MKKLLGYLGINTYSVRVTKVQKNNEKIAETHSVFAFSGKNAIIKIHKKNKTSTSTSYTEYEVLSEKRGIVNF